MGDFDRAGRITAAGFRNGRIQKKSISFGEDCLLVELYFVRRYKTYYVNLYGNGFFISNHETTHLVADGRNLFQSVYNAAIHAIQNNYLKLN